MKCSEIYSWRFEFEYYSYFVLTIYTNTLYDKLEACMIVLLENNKFVFLQMPTVMLVVKAESTQTLA